MDSKFATDTDLFVEVFPINETALPELTAYAITADLPGPERDRLGRRLANRFRKQYDGLWRWMDGYLVTDTPRDATELAISADILRARHPDRYGALETITTAADIQLSASELAQMVLAEQANSLRKSIADILSKANTRLNNARIERDHRIQAWDVGGVPALSLTIASRLLYKSNLATYIGETEKRVEVADLVGGLRVEGINVHLRGEITGVPGRMKKERVKLLESLTDEVIQGLVLAAPDDDWVVQVRAGQDQRTFPASMLRLVVRVSDIGRFDVDRAAAIEALQMKPPVRAAHVRSVSDVLKDAGIIGSAYNSRIVPERFFSADFEMNLRYGDTGGVAKRVRPYRAEILPDDFAQCGAYRIREPFKGSTKGNQPVRICIVNTLDSKLNDFVEALQRAIKRSFAFEIEIVRERKVRVVSQSNLESAVRVVEKEDPDIILAFIPDSEGGDDDEGEDGNATDAYVRSLTLGRALPVHIIYESILDDPDAMSRIVLSILGKTGSAPFVLAEPLEGVDFVVGLSLVRETKKSTGQTRLIAIARIYKADGEFVRYVVGDLIQEAGDSAPPYVLVRDLFPQRDFAKQRVLIHHDGPLPDDLRAAIAVWVQAIGATFYPVEIHRFGAPRLYGLERGVTQPAWGSAFKFSDNEALLVSGVPEADITPQPVRVKSLAFGGSPAFPIEEALRGVLVWSLLAYGAKRPPKLPVTVVNADQLAYWLRRGNTFDTIEGRVPFWL